VTSLVVGWNSNIDELGWGVGVAESDNWDVDLDFELATTQKHHQQWN